MEIWDIKVLLLGKITMPFSTLLGVHYPFGAPAVENDFDFNAPYLGFLLQGAGCNIMVDTGISEKFFVGGKAWAGLPAEGGQSYVMEALAREGLTPGDIDTGIYTHLHNDHAGNCGLFPQAEFIFQKEEWQNLLDPLPVQKLRRDYDPDLIEELKTLRCKKIDGDLRLGQGLDIYKTPGHTRGGQSVAVQTAKGVVVLVGDLFTSYISAFPYLDELVDMEGRAHKIPPAPQGMELGMPGSITYDF
jgi:N-acyl homoserine lactone hydrolase